MDRDKPIYMPGMDARQPNSRIEHMEIKKTKRKKKTEKQEEERCARTSAPVAFGLAELERSKENNANGSHPGPSLTTTRVGIRITAGTLADWMDMQYLRS